MKRFVFRWGIAAFTVLPAVTQGGPAKDYCGDPGRSTSYWLEAALQGSEPGGAGNLNALPLVNSVPVAGHAEAGEADFAVLGSTVFYQMTLDPETEVLDMRVAMDSGDADIFAGPVLPSPMAWPPSWSW